MKNEKKNWKECFESYSHSLFQPLQGMYALMTLAVGSKESKFYVFFLIFGFSKCDFVFGKSSDF